MPVDLKTLVSKKVSGDNADKEFNMSLGKYSSKVVKKITSYLETERPSEVAETMALVFYYIATGVFEIKQVGQLEDGIKIEHAPAK